MSDLALVSISGSPPSGTSVDTSKFLVAPRKLNEGTEAYFKRLEKRIPEFGEIPDDNSALVQTLVEEYVSLAGILTSLSKSHFDTSELAALSTFTQINLTIAFFTFTRRMGNLEGALRQESKQLIKSAGDLSEALGEVKRDLGSAEEPESLQGRIAALEGANRRIADEEDQFYGEKGTLEASKEKNEKDLRGMEKRFKELNESLARAYKTLQTSEHLKNSTRALYPPVCFLEKADPKLVSSLKNNPWKTAGDILFCEEFIRLGMFEKINQAFALSLFSLLLNGNYTAIKNTLFNKKRNIKSLKAIFASALNYIPLQSVKNIFLFLFYSFIQAAIQKRRQQLAEKNYKRLLSQSNEVPRVLASTLKKDISSEEVTNAFERAQAYVAEQDQATYKIKSMEVLNQVLLAPGSILADILLKPLMRKFTGGSH